MAIHVGDDIEIVQSNREKLSQNLSLPRQPIWLNQVHGNKIINVTHDYSLSDGDGFYCKELDKPCGILTADCLPILICSTKKKEIAAIHAGWRGLGSGIIKRALDMFESSSEDVIAYLGPAISSEVFEVGYEVREYFCDHAENLVEKNRIKAAFAKRGRINCLQIYTSLREWISSCMAFRKYMVVTSVVTEIQSYFTRIDVMELRAEMLVLYGLNKAAFTLLLRELQNLPKYLL